jgi:hypothetical protein
MEETLLELLGVIVEAILEIAGESLLSLLARLFGGVFTTFFELNPIAISIGLAMLGAGAGFLSVAVIPHPLVHPTRFHGLSLVLSPLIAGLIMSRLGRALRRRNRATIPIETFSYGFVFALAMAIVRFVMVH